MKLVKVRGKIDDVRRLMHNRKVMNADMPEFEIGIFFSGLTRSLVNSDYNLRVYECKTAAWNMLEQGDGYCFTRATELGITDLRIYGGQV